MRIAIISGDDDAVCGTRGTELWLTRMGCVAFGMQMLGVHSTFLTSHIFPKQTTTAGGRS